MRVLSSSADRAFALSGEVSGRGSIFVLKEGANTVGRGAGSDVALLSSGVSERHAVVEVENGALSVRDLASKNGTFVDGQRTSAGAATVESTVQFGPVILRVEEVDPEDAFLSVTARRQSDSAATRTTESHSSTAAWSGAVKGLRRRQWLQLLDDVTGELGSGLETAPGRALASLCRGLDIGGATLLGIPPEGSPIVLASFGEFPEDLPVNDIEESQTQARQQGSVQIFGSSNPVETWTIVAGSGEGSPVLYLVGELSCDGVVATLLRIVLQAFSLHVGGSSERTEVKDRSSRGLRYPKDYVPGNSRPMQTVYGQIGSVACSDLPMLFVGETGVGKECLASTVHLSSDRSSGPFLPINCAAIPADLLEAELFGIARGVATGVVERSGRFKLAEGGTLFLDEIGDMSSALQAKLLRALEERVIQPVGGSVEEIDVRLIAATNTDLGKKVETGEFRRDLYYRLAGLVVTIPPLRQRVEDLAGLIEFFFHQVREESGRDVSGLTYAAMRRLAERRWPGNVRELRHAVRRLVLMCPDGRAIDSGMVVALEEGSLPEFGGLGGGAGPDFSTWESLDLSETTHGLLEEAMRRAGGNQTAAAELLGVTRSSLRRRLVKFSVGGLDEDSEPADSRSDQDE
jgi:DNA-binding NtrC family response regulator